MTSCKQSKLLGRLLYRAIYRKPYEASERRARSQMWGHTASPVRRKESLRGRGRPPEERHDGSSNGRTGVPESGSSRTTPPGRADCRPDGRCHCARGINSPIYNGLHTPMSTSVPVFAGTQYCTSDCFSAHFWGRRGLRRERRRWLSGLTRNAALLWQWINRTRSWRCPPVSREAPDRDRQGCPRRRPPHQRRDRIHRGFLSRRLRRCPSPLPAVSRRES
jgi:hypothetical protein